MATQLTSEQRRDLEQHGNLPVPVVDPVTNAIYYLIHGELFERCKVLFDDEPFEISETYAAQERTLAKVWEDPALDVYNEEISPQS